MGVRLAVLATALVCWTTAAIAAPAAPSSDPFYSYAGSLAKLAPGTVLKTRTVPVDLGDELAAPITATQVLYRTTDQIGEPAVTVATIIKPLISTGGTRLLSYQTAYDGVSDTCRPSYQLQGGSPTNTILVAENALILAYVEQGFTVVTTDYEGPTDDYGAGQEEGYNTLDGIRAAEHALDLPTTTGVALVGYSGGSIASEWASQEQPTYASALHLIGVAEGGIPVDFTHNLNYIAGSSDWAGAIPAVGMGLLRAYKLDPNAWLSAYGKQVEASVEQGCLNPSAYPGLTFPQLLAPQYKNWQQVPELVKIFNNTIMGRGATPKEPLLMGVGDADGTGDGVMIAKDVQELADEYCKRGVNVEFHIYNGLNHIEALTGFEPQALAFVHEVYNGETPSDGCSGVTPGNALTPLPTPKPAAKKVHKKKHTDKRVKNKHGHR